MALGCLLTVVGSAVVAESVDAQESASGLPEWVEDLASSEPNDPDPVPWEESSSAPVPEEAPAPPEPEVAFPEPAVWDVDLESAGVPAAVAEGSADDLGVESVDDLPVMVTPGIDPMPGGQLQVEVFDQAVAERAGATGFVFSLSGIDAAEIPDPAGATEDATTGEAASPPESFPVELMLDYAGFAQAYGGDFASRLKVVALPDCVLEDPVPAGCNTVGVRLPATNDHSSQHLAVQLDDLRGLAASVHRNESETLPPDALGSLDIGEPDPETAGAAGAQHAAANEDESAVVLAMTSDPCGDTGCYRASPMSISGEWQVGTGSGEFNYSYPVSVPAPAAGYTPSLGLGYSSAAIDGLTVATNPQASQTGLGWSDFANAYIERGYTACAADPGWFQSLDLCWMGENAAITLNGVSSPLLPVPGTNNTRWRLQSDPGWTVERLTGAVNSTIHEGQWWRVTAPDGTKYSFGLGHGPGRNTNSTLGVSVFADEVGEPCYPAQGNIGGCVQGWRWYLDRVEDPDGVTAVFQYEKETNYYDAANGMFGRSGYDRSAVLKEIVYGGEGPRGWDHRTYAGKVTFDTLYRCSVDWCHTTPPQRGQGIAYWDTPTDLICTADTNVQCGVNSPSFFSAKRYTSVTTWVARGGASTSESWDSVAWQPVSRYHLRHSYGTGQNGASYKLQLDGIRRQGIAFGQDLSYPETTLAYWPHNNRLDYQGQEALKMPHNRLGLITNELGGQIAVEYGFNRQCVDGYQPPEGAWDYRNTRDCFRQNVIDDGFSRSGTFYKYLVRSTREVPEPGRPSSDIVSTYTYEGDPAWGFDDTSFSRDDDENGFSVWRGYGSTVVTQGASKTRTRSFRGWHGDWVLRKNTQGQWVPDAGAHVALIDGIEDLPILAGRPREIQRLASDSSMAQSTLHTYEVRDTLPAGSYLRGAQWAAVSTVIERVATAGGFRERGSETFYNDHLQPTDTVEFGWNDVLGDERCSRTTYADNLDRGMLTYPALNQLIEGSDCNAGTVLTETQTYYDNSTNLGQAPTRGHPTMQRTRIDSSTSAETATEFDDLGRPIKVTYPRGGVTTTSYAPKCQVRCVEQPWLLNQAPIKTSVTNPLQHTSTTDWHNEFGVPSSTTDANANVTTYGYDGLGRNLWVRQPTEQGTSEYSWQFSYDIPNRAVRSRRLTSGTGTSAIYEDAWLIYDGVGRERQTQALSPASTTEAPKTLVSETTYDERGLLRDETVAQAFAGSPGAYIDGRSEWINRTRHVHDELGRETEQQWFREKNTTTPAHRTLTSYGPDTVTVTGPDGLQVHERVDGLGRTDLVGEFDGQNWVNSTYRYDLADRLTSVTDPAGTIVSYSYNNAGWRTSQQDPNRGSATFGYDLAGNQTSVVDGSGHAVHTKYDVLSRPTERRRDSITGPRLATWTYDATGEKGLLDSSTSYDPEGKNWISDVTGYDSRGRAKGTKLTVPSGFTGLSGSYTQTQTYDLADQVTSVTYPAMGDLAEEKVTNTYNALGLPTKLAGATTYVSRVNYDDRGRPSLYAQGPAQAYGWMLRWPVYDGDQRVGEAETRTWNGSAYETVAKHAYSYRNDGLLAERTTVLNGQQNRECYGYDPRGRLTESYTVTLDTTTTCATGQRGSGQLAYNHSYRYNAAGNMTQRTENGTTADYAYPAATAAQPNAPTQVGADTYTWNAEGQLASRTVGGKIETFSWDVQGLLASVTGPEGTTSFVYDADGQRLLRKTPQGSTLYFAGHEVTANTSGAATAVRSYSLAGELIATRSAAGVDYAVTDGAGSVEMTIRSGASTAATRAYNPYGEVRTATGTKATDRGFLGQVEDKTTTLSYLNARYYDTNTGVFTSADAVYNTSNIKSLNPYTYASGNPASFSDASGLSSAYTYGLEFQNQNLRLQNSQLIGHIGYLNGKLGEAQNIINEQSRIINELLTHVAALEAIITQMESIIYELQAQVSYLQWVVRQQARTISKLLGQITYYKGVIKDLVPLAYHPDFHGYVFGQIWTGKGVPSDAAWGTYQFAYNGLLYQHSLGRGNASPGIEGSSVAQLREMGGPTSLRSEIGRLESENAELIDSLGVANGMSDFWEQKYNESQEFDWGAWALDLAPALGTARDLYDGLEEGGCWFEEETGMDNIFFEC